MPPKKKAQKIALSDFLADDSPAAALGSWADEVDALPTAPAMRTEEEMRNDRYGGRRDDFLATRRPLPADRTFGPPREEVPIPDRPPYTVFVGNLAFDLTEAELGEFFQPLKIKEVKVIRDREGKAKGFGYIEFEDVESLKEALDRSGTSFANRTIRVSVAEPPKERSGFGGGFEDDAKFDNPWRRDKPPPSADVRGDSRDRDPSQRRFEAASAVSDSVSAWRSAKPRGSPTAGDDGARAPRRTGFGFGDGAAGAADAEESWSRGARFRPSQPSTPAEEHPPSRFGSRRGDMGPPREPSDEGEWRRARPPRGSTSPTGSTPPTPQLGRRKLDLLPRTESTSASPLSSPKLGSAAPAHSRPNPFGAARPVDVTSREREVEQRVEREREALHSMSRTGSRQGAQRAGGAWERSAPSSPKPAAAQAIARTTSNSGSARAPAQANVRPSFSFASAAGGKGGEEGKEAGGEAAKEAGDKEAEKVAEKLGEVTI
ncbi:hypothetical protein HDZ31DRAFT_73558 [Schizophyllum fasciatum]